MSDIARDAVEMCCSVCMMIACDTTAQSSLSLPENDSGLCQLSPRRAPDPPSSPGPAGTAGAESSQMGFPIYQAKIPSLKPEMENCCPALLGTPGGTRDANCQHWLSQGDECHRG